MIVYKASPHLMAGKVENVHVALNEWILELHMLMQETEICDIFLHPEI